MTVIMNPGTGPVDGATVAHAEANMHEFCADLNLDGLTWERASGRDYGAGRFCFLLRRGERETEIQMPGLPVERVAFGRGENDNPWHFPRLYVDGCSWLWPFALDIAAGELDERGEERER